MCDFEDMDIRATYPLPQAAADGVLVEILNWNGKPVMATAHLRDEFSLGELWGVWHEFQSWKKNEEPQLSEEERLFHAYRKQKKIWVIEDAATFTLMYPEDY